MKQAHPELPLDFRGDMNHVYFDVAGFPLQKQMQALLKDVSIDNLLYGSDTPYTPDIACTALSGGLEDIDWLSDEEKAKMFYGNAAILIPRLTEILGITPEGKTINYANHQLTRKEKRNRRTRKWVAKLYGTIFNN